MASASVSSDMAIMNVSDELWRLKMHHTALWCSYVAAKAFSLLSPCAPVATAYHKSQFILGRFSYPGVVLTGLIYVFQSITNFISNRLVRNAGLSLAASRHRIEVLNKVYDRMASQGLAHNPTFNPLSKLNPFYRKPLYVYRSDFKKVECIVENESAEAAFTRFQENYRPPQELDDQQPGFWDSEMALRIYKRASYRIMAHQLAPSMLKVLHNELTEKSILPANTPLPKKLDYKGWDNLLQSKPAHGIFYVDVPFADHQQMQHIETNPNVSKKRPFICLITNEGKKFLNFYEFEALVEKHMGSDFEVLQADFFNHFIQK